MSLSNLLSRIRGRGWIPNVPDKRDWDVDRLGLPGKDLPEEASLASHVRGIRNQGYTSSCVGQALAAAVDLREVLAGYAYRPASALFAYYHARRSLSPVVADRGTHIRQAVKMMGRLGIPDDDHWPFSVRPWVVNRRPGWEAHMMAHPRRGGQYYAIGGYGAERLLAIRSAICSGRPVVFGTSVPRSFLADAGPDVVDRPMMSDELVGGHAMVLIGYRHDRAEGLVFRCLNSWGVAWRDEGLCWLTESYVRWERSRDFTIIDGWDRIRERAS